MDTNSKLKAEDVIIEYLNKYSKTYCNAKYKEQIQKIARVDLTDINEDNQEDVKRIIKAYLYDFGKIQRVIGQKKYSGWQDKCIEIIDCKGKKLNEYRKINFAYTNLNKYKDDIKECYDKFKNNYTVGRIGAAKLLHLLCPNFFPMWDTAIINAFRNELKESKMDDITEKSQKSSGDEYYKFMLWIQKLLRSHKSTFSSFSNKDKSELKIIDECLLWAVRRPFCLFF